MGVPSPSSRRPLADGLNGRTSGSCDGRLDFDDQELFCFLGHGPQERLGGNSVKPFRFGAVIGALALSVFTQGATAQPASTTQPTAARAPVDLFLQDPVFYSPDLSPDGRYVVAVHREAVGDVITVLDLQSHHISRVSIARADQAMRVSSVWFKANDRIVFSVRQRVRVTQARSTMFRNRDVEDSFEWDSRIYSSNIDGTDVRALYDPSQQQGVDRLAASL